MKSYHNTIIKFLAMLLIISLISGCQPPLKPPNAPTNLVAEALSQTEIKLTWKDNSNNEEGFKIERKTEGGNYTLIGSVGANVTTYTDTDLTPGTKYYYRVYAFNSAGNSGYSNEASATTLSPEAPNAPSNLQAEVKYPNKIFLTWQDNSNNEDGFKIYRKVPGGEWEFLTTVEADVTQYEDTPSILTLLEYKVTAYKGDLESTPTTATATGFSLLSTFETGTENWFGRGGCNVEQSSTTKNTGQYSLRTYNRDATWKGPSITLYDSNNNINNIITPGKEYYLSIWVYQSSGTSTEYVTITVDRTKADGGKAYDTVAWRRPVPYNTWTLITAYTIFHSDTVNSQLYVESPNANLEFYIDDVVLVEKPSQ